MCSVISLAIIFERFWSLQEKRIAPKHLVAQVWQWAKVGHLNNQRIRDIRAASPLGRILAAGLVNRSHEREVMKESIEEVGRQVAHSLERFLNTLGTIASISPLLGLLGTVIGMIKVFAVITTHGVGDASILAEGISRIIRRHPNIDVSSLLQRQGG
jgi:biopolymer transport protein ExbB